VEAYEKNSQGRPDPKHLKAHLQYWPLAGI
jgi:hypothetical protein